MIDTVLFDLDGTIINTNELIIATFLQVIDKHGLGPYTREQIIPHMGTTLEHQLQTFSGQEDVAALVADYRKYNRERHDELIDEFPHVKEVLAELHERGVTMGIVTTKIRETTMLALERFGFLDYMKTIVTVDDVSHPKPHPEPILTALNALQADPARTLMVGDSAADLLCAKAAGVHAAGVAWSLKGEAELRKYDPDYIIQDMTELYAILEGESVKP
ncbi:pyrophosphatase PpaX [Paenibacillus senegalimassiliensis]|uniref:pyrophosphatase PpaX n=1 Tax=Paenibacillus senegalimassiliensis TaxID=1737426 RepID=UPI00073E6CB1|nr:pyrophosphatase PpaX [Paenibacillus senegalimassiliensis]